jgi:hypothetical protein
MKWNGLSREGVGFIAQRTSSFPQWHCRLSPAIGRVVPVQLLGCEPFVSNSCNATQFGSLQALAKNSCLWEGKEVKLPQTVSNNGPAILPRQNPERPSNSVQIGEQSQGL